MLSRLIRVAAVGLAVLTFGACSSATTPTPTKGVASPPATTVTQPVTAASRDESQMAEPITLAVGQQARISLAANRTTGYAWGLAKPLNESVVKQSAIDYVAPAGGGLGAGGTEVWTFTAIGTGQETVSMKYFRSFEPNGTPARETSFTIVVRGAS